MTSAIKSKSLEWSSDGREEKGEISDMESRISIASWGRDIKYSACARIIFADCDLYSMRI